MSDHFFRRSSFCSVGTCVEVSLDGDVVLLRDGKDPDAAVLVFSSLEWAEFLRGVRAGEFDSNSG